MENSFYISWLEYSDKFKKWLVPGAILLGLLLILCFRSCRSSQGGAVHDFIQGFGYEKGLFLPESQEESWNGLSALVARYPELQGEYDALLVQGSLLYNHPFSPMAERTFFRVGQSDSSDVALLIHEGKYEAALPLVKKSLDELKDAPEEKNFFLALALFRKAFIEGKLGQSKEAANSYNALYLLLKKQTVGARLFQKAIEGEEGEGPKLLQFLEAQAQIP